MLSDEEKAVLKTAKENYGLTSAEQKILVNLIEKQSKEIEDNKKYIDLHYVPYEQYTSKLNELNKKWKDKLKAKIEDLESQINDIKDNLDYEYNESMVNEVWRLENKIDVLQSLLEKE